MKHAVESITAESAFALAAEVTKFITGVGIETPHIAEGVRNSRREIVSLQTHVVPVTKRHPDGPRAGFDYVAFLTYSENPLPPVRTLAPVATLTPPPRDLTKPLAPETDLWLSPDERTETALAVFDSEQALTAERNEHLTAGRGIEAAKLTNRLQALRSVRSKLECNR